MQYCRGLSICFGLVFADGKIKPPLKYWQRVKVTLTNAEIVFHNDSRRHNAAGEAVGGMHGAVRLGGDLMPTAVIFGCIGGSNRW